jgi:ATP-dependent DNA helicase RecG
VDRIGTKWGPGRHQVEILHKSLIDTGITGLLEIAERTDRTKFRNQVLNPLIEAGFLEMTVPDKPRSSKQKYRVTEQGRDLLAKQKKGEV